MPQKDHRNKPRMKQDAIPWDTNLSCYSCVARAGLTEEVAHILMLARAAVPGESPASRVKRFAKWLVK